MASNQSIIEKATMTLSDLAAGGLMNPMQFKKFYQMMIDQPTIVNEARTVPMTSDSMKIEKIGFGQRILHPGVDATALEASKRSKPTTGKIELNAKEVIAEVNISYDTLENNIEGGNLHNTIISMIAERASLDVEELIVNGDKTSSDPYLALLDGLRKQATSHIVDHDGGDFKRPLLKKLYGSVPAKYLRNPADFRYYMSHVNELNWRDEIANRNTGLGDTTLTGTNRPAAYGVPTKGIAMLQPYDATVSGGTEKVSDLLLTHPKNIVLGVSRNVRLEFDKDIRSRTFIIVLTMKLDTKFEEEDAVAKAINVKHEII